MKIFKQEGRKHQFNASDISNSHRKYHARRQTAAFVSFVCL
jgi:hypothetical protein